MTSSSRNTGCLGVVVGLGCAGIAGAMLGIAATKQPSSPASSVVCPPTLAPSASSVGSVATNEIVVHPPAPTVDIPARSGDELVRAAVGRWVDENGTIVEIDPPKAAPGRAPPYRLIVRSVSLPKSGYGCEFALGETRRGPGELLFYRAWCSQRSRSTLGLGLDASGQLSIVILSDGDVKIHADKMTKVGP